MQLDDLLGYQLRRASQAMLADLARSIAPLGLIVTEMSILLTLADGQDMTQSDVGRVLGIQRANMAPLMAGLVGRGLVARMPVDGRSQALTLTPDGLALLALARSQVELHEARFLPDLSARERGKLLRLLGRVWQQEDGKSGPH